MLPGAAGFLLNPRVDLATGSHGPANGPRVFHQGANALVDPESSKSVARSYKGAESAAEDATRCQASGPAPTGRANTRAAANRKNDFMTS